MNKMISNPICQSCGMPMRDRNDFGIDKEGKKTEEYCRHCYHAGRFTDEGISLKDFIERQTQMGMQKFGMSEKEARARAKSVLPGLKRWQGEKNFTKIAVWIGILVTVLVLLITFFVTADRAGGNVEGDGPPIAAMVPIWVAIFVPIIAQKQNKGQENQNLHLQKKLLFFSLLLGTIFLVGLTVFIRSNR